MIVHPHNEPWGLKCDLTLQGQKLNVNCIAKKQETVKMKTETPEKLDALPERKIFKMNTLTKLNQIYNTVWLCQTFIIKDL